MKKRDLLQLLILFGLSACTNAPTVPARTTTVTVSDATGSAPDLSGLDRDIRQSATGARAENVWEFRIEGSGTPFEKRWANADPLTDESSAGSMLGFAGISADEGGLELYIGDPYPIADVLVSALAGEELECDFENWRLAVDRHEFRIDDSSRSTDNSATFLQPQDEMAFWQAFVDGSLLAVQFERTCDGDMNVATLVYSLVGSQAAVEYVLN